MHIEIINPFKILEMKRTISILLVLFTVVFLFPACEKDDDNLSNTITGQLTANENMTDADLSEVSVSLLKLPDGFDLESITSETDLTDLMKTVPVNADGSFVFENLENGNYILLLSDGFSFASDSFVIVSLADGMTAKVNKSVNRVPDDNPFGS